jgi:putative SOS response-associated peptidase YedK
MCGRYGRRGDKQKIAEQFHVEGKLPEVAFPVVDYNIAPSTDQPIIRQSRETGGRELVMARWGLIPFFTKSASDIKNLRTINARADKVETSPSWREPMKKRRCLVPASWIYEWPEAGKPPKQPYRMEMSNGSTFAIAGLWDAWKDETGRWIQSFAMVTTEANELMAQIHSRIPVMLHERDYDRWLDRGETQRLPLDLLRPYEAEAMEMHEANPKVGKTGNNGPDMMTNPGPPLATFPVQSTFA